MSFILSGLSPVNACDLPKSITDPILKQYPNAVFMLDQNSEVIVGLGVTNGGQNV